MSTWLRADMYFGDNGKIFVVNMRSRLGNNFFRELKTSQATAEEIDEAEKKIIAGILEIRPELLCMTLVGIECKLHPQQWEFLVLHPSLPRVKMGESFPRENLELCDICKKPLPLPGDGKKLCQIEKHGEVLLICEDCYEAENLPVNLCREVTSSTGNDYGPLL